MLAATMRNILLSLSLVVLVGGCKKAIDPAYKAALDARHEAVCACLKEQAAAAVACYDAATKQHPEPAPPGGVAIGVYRDSLNDEGNVFVSKMEGLTSACDARVSKYVTDYKAAEEQKAQQAAKDEQAKQLAQQATKTLHPEKKAKAKAKKHHKKKR
jgi:hypothetical protein